MSYDGEEISIASGEPIECYKFDYYDMSYCYTSSQYMQQIDGVVYNPEYIKRGDSLKLGDSGGSVETCIITVPRTNNVALLYQGAPPELSSVKVQVFRLHGNNIEDRIRILDGVVSQVSFINSEAQLTITIENVLNRYIPRGTLSYNCQNCIYDEKCNLKASAYAFEITVASWDKLSLKSLNLLEKSSGYFTDGYLKTGHSVRAISLHQNDIVRFKYPINDNEKYDKIVVYPGCSQVFENCATRFNNTDNFNGIPYIPPFNVYKHNGYSGKLPYWIDGNLHYFDTKGNTYSMSL